MTFTDYKNFRQHLRVVHDKRFIPHEDLVLFERRPGSLRYVENLPQHFSNNWVTRPKQFNVPDHSLVVRNRRNPFRNQPTNMPSINIDGIFDAIGKSVSMGKNPFL